jgi:hypothetical protein
MPNVSGMRLMRRYVSAAIIQAKSHQTTSKTKSLHGGGDENNIAEIGIVYQGGPGISWSSWTPLTIFEQC